MAAEKRFRSLFLGEAGLLLAVPLLAACGSDRPTEDRGRHEPHVASVISAEQAFAVLAAEVGTREAFLAVLADDAIVFRPRAVSARAWFESQRPSQGLLAWQPILADASAAGDMGFTTGPWTYRAEKDGRPAAFGNYFTVWRRGEDGRWRVVIDHGTSNTQPDSIPALVHPDHELVRPDAGGLNASPLGDTRALLDTDRAFSGAATRHGLHAALAGYVAADVRALRDGSHPIVGITALRDYVAARPGAVAWQPLGGAVASSGDLGYTYGEYWITSGSSDSIIEAGNYLRAWRNNALGRTNWRVIVDLMSPIPASGG